MKTYFKDHPRKQKTLYVLAWSLVLVLFLYFIVQQEAPLDQQVEAGADKYVLVLDAGSTGSRIHVFKFELQDGMVHHVQSEVFHELKPGLSAYAVDPVEAARSLIPLMDVAMNNVPEDYQKCTLLILKATAGLRLLEGDQSTAILKEARYLLETEYPFPLLGKEAVEVMDGSDEGVYAWMTVNFLLSKLAEEETCLIMDLGGGSTQIVYAVDPGLDFSSPGLAPHAAQFNFGGMSHKLYQHSYLGFGLHQSRWKMANAAELSSHPCLPSGVTETLNNGPSALTMTGSGQGFNMCYELAKKILRKERKCPVDTQPGVDCGFNGVLQPSLIDLAKFSKIHAFSYFYDRIMAQHSMQDEEPLISIRELQVVALDECTFTSSSDPMLCMDLTYMYTLLKDGYRFSAEDVLHLTKKIDGFETGWALGAGVDVIGAHSELSCHRFLGVSDPI